MVEVANLGEKGNFPPTHIGRFSRPDSDTETEYWKLCSLPLKASFPGHNFMDEESRITLSCVTKLRLHASL